MSNMLLLSSAGFFTTNCTRCIMGRFNRKQMNSIFAPTRSSMDRKYEMSCGRG